MKPTNTDQKKPSPSKRRVLWLCVAGLSMAALVVGIVYFANRQAERDRQAQLEQLAGPSPAVTATPSPMPTPSPTPVPTEEPTPEPTPTPWPLAKTYKSNERDIDFAALLEINPHVVGWIEIPGTAVDYALVYSGENTVYLDHDLYGKKSAYGTIFLDAWNEAGLGENHVVLYGHNMKDGMMFATLHKYKNTDFFAEHRDIRIYTPQGQLDYVVFAAYERDDRYILDTYEHTTQEGFAQYLEEMPALVGERGILEMEGLSMEGGILTLSTCVNGNGSMRLVVEAAYVG